MRYSTVHLQKFFITYVIFRIYYFADLLTVNEKFEIVVCSAEVKINPCHLHYLYVFYFFLGEKLVLSLLYLLSSFAAFCWTKTVHLRLREQTPFSAEKGVCSHRLLDANTIGGACEFLACVAHGSFFGVLFVSVS